MMLMLTMIFFFFMVSSLILFINFLVSSKLMKNREKISPFECGFDPLSKSRMPFSIQFFLISLIFLIFDIEMIFLIPLPFLMMYLNKMTLFQSLFFLIMLITGLLIEYFEQSIDWKI